MARVAIPATGGRGEQHSWNFVFNGTVNLVSSAGFAEVPDFFCIYEVSQMLLLCMRDPYAQPTSMKSLYIFFNLVCSSALYLLCIIYSPSLAEPTIYQTWKCCNAWKYLWQELFHRRCSSCRLLPLLWRSYLVDIWGFPAIWSKKCEL